MTDKHEDKETSETVAPGYPVIATLKNIDVSEWEPAAIFRPVSLQDPEEEKDAAGDSA